MATTETATLHTLHQPRPKTGAERAAAYRARKAAAPKMPKTPEAAHVTSRAPSGTLAPVTRVTPVTTVTPPSRSVAQLLLVGTSFGLAVVGITMNGWFAHTLGSSQIAGWLFAAIGVAADLVALATPSCAAAQWQASRRAPALAGWLVWLVTFVFAVTAGIGFASVNIADVTASRGERVTPAVTLAQTAYADAMASRDRECKGGVGKVCREREAAVAERRTALDAAMATVEHAADPQTEAASKIVSWLSAGMAKPSSGDIAMLRLVLLSLLPQLGGILLMVSRR
jgi:hypothetical protein